MRVTVHQTIADFSPAEWNALTAPDDPFTEHAFLKALEDSRSVGRGTGWEPVFLAVRDGDRLQAAMPLYAKSHSYGEYIFDWSWANASHQAGIAYYPKLVAAVPFTPVGGRRILTPDGALDSPAVMHLMGGVEEVAAQTGASSVHMLFSRADERTLLASDHGYQPRLTYQFHWENAGYRDFEDYLSTFRSSARKQMRRERREAQAHGLEICTREGPELTEEEWDALYPFYRSTVEWRGGVPYLQPAFFREIRAHMAERVVVALASENGSPVAGALAFRKGDSLYGRYWGTMGDFGFLHFELCYHQLIEYAIEKGLRRFEAGAQGEHKLKRGLLPAPTYSAHRIAHPGLAAAVADFLPRETAAVEREMEALRAHGPFHHMQQKSRIPNP